MSPSPSTTLTSHPLSYTEMTVVPGISMKCKLGEHLYEVQAGRQMASSTGIAKGLKKGYPVQKLEAPPRPANRKGRLGKKVKLVREVIRDVVGLMPYEKRILDVLKTGGSSSEKKVYKYAKKRLGTHRRAMRKREEIKEYWSNLRARHGH